MALCSSKSDVGSLGIEALKAYPILRIVDKEKI